MEPLSLSLRASSWAPGLGAALGQQFVQGVAWTLPWLHDQAAFFNGDADPGTGLQLQYVEQRWRDGQHDRASDFAQVGGVHGIPHGYIIV